MYGVVIRQSYTYFTKYFVWYFKEPPGFVHGYYNCIWHPQDSFVNISLKFLISWPFHPVSMDLMCFHSYAVLGVAFLMLHISGLRADSLLKVMRFLKLKCQHTHTCYIWSPLYVCSIDLESVFLLGGLKAGRLVEKHLVLNC